MTSARNLRELVDHRAEKTPSRVFFVSAEDGKRVSFAALRESLRAQVCEFARLKIGAGEVFGILAGNGWPTVRLMLSAAYGGRIQLPLNGAAGDAQLARILARARCRTVFVDDENRERLEKILRLPDAPPNVAIVDAEAEPDPNSADGRDDAVSGTVGPDTLALLMFTSGTTGSPKGVMHSHAGLLAGGRAVESAHRLSADDRALCVLPLCHINGQCVTVFAPLVSGGSVVVARRFSAKEFWRQVAENECSWFSVVPTIVSRLLESETDSDSRPASPKLRFGRSASSALAPEAKARFEKRFGVPMIETMGLTETAGTILSNPPPPQAGRPGSAGIACGCEVRVLDSQGREAARNAEGEIAVRGGNVMVGYFEDDAATAESFSPDGWHLTGDLGRMDSDGYVYVTGRRKELIVKGGENIAPRELDDALYSDPAVAEAAAFARPCPTYGQRPEACVVVRPSGARSEAELIALCVREVGKFKAPERIHFMDELPKGPSGKIQRLKLLALVSGGEEGKGGEDGKGGKSGESGKGGDGA